MQITIKTIEGNNIVFSPSNFISAIVKEDSVVITLTDLIIEVSPDEWYKVKPMI